MPPYNVCAHEQTLLEERPGRDLLVHRQIVIQALFHYGNRLRLHKMAPEEGGPLLRRQHAEFRHIPFPKHGPDRPVMLVKIVRLVLQRVCRGAGIVSRRPGWSADRRILRPAPHFPQPRQQPGDFVHRCPYCAAKRLISL
ncbi:hypothetical protein CH35J_012867 [Colletotrichum higginsianum]|uniref:Uncharacterized protein n=1 Tax=Colletotrichum higginsianum TaxID=80884 RepID=A0A4T0VBX6_9PEZI|nr:hypothetical protein CH35J_012867 [Colletotrichum higginsianum]